MIVNPFSHKERMATFAGTRLLQQDFGIIGRTIADPAEPYRIWSIQSLYAPAPGRALGGIRAKLVDQKNVITFINQMDLEVLLGLVRPGTYCRWSERTYAEPGGRDFYGMVADEDDLIDDLYDRELLMRGQSPTGMLEGQIDLIRYVHLEESRDVEEYYILMWDGDPDTGISPDIRLETIEKRWVRVERTRAPWDLIGT
jgi:hypothetical protein